jgi:transposase InsO family protein
MPSAATFYRLVAVLAEGRHTFGAATTRRSLANRPDGPFTATWALRPGERVQIDTTPLDVMAVLDDGVLGRPELTIAVDVATRTLCAAVLRPGGTKAVDAALLLARMLVPEPMRPGWSQSLELSRSRIPHERLLSLDARLEHAAAKPVIMPDTIVCDRGKVYLSRAFLTACQSLGVSVQPAHPRTPTDKGIVERTFESINTLFTQYLPGHTGRDTAHRGADVASSAVWTLPELQDLLDEWILAGWQSRPHEGLRNPHDSSQVLSPNEMYAALVATAGYLPVPLSGDDYIELLPALWRTVNDYGVRIDHRTYDCAELNPHRRQPSGIDAQRGLWEVHYDPYDLSVVWVRDQRAGRWIAASWTHLPMVQAPFADFTWRQAREIVADRKRDDTDETEVARALAALLTRAGTAPARQQRVAARTAASPSILPDMARPPRTDPEPAPDVFGEVVPFGVFDPLAEEDYR